LGTEALTYRRLDVLIRALPREAATVRAVAGPAAEWGDLEHLTATMVDELRGLWYTYVSAHTTRSKKPKKPKPIIRPGAEDKKPKKVRMSMADMKARLQAQYVDIGVDKVID